MVGRQDSWTKEYTEVVDFEVPLLASPPTPSPSFPSMSFAQAQGQAQAQVPQSMSQPARLSPPAAAVGGHHPPQSSQPHDQSTIHHNDDNAHHPPNPASFARQPPSHHASFKNLPSSPLNPASPPHQHHQNHGMPTPSTPAGAHGPAHPPAPFGSNVPRPGSRGSQTLPSPHSVPNFSRMANEELRALNAASTAGPYPSNLTSQGLTGGSRGSMILYRRADSFVGTPVLAGEDGGGQLHFLPPPPVGGFGGGGGGSNRGSMYSVSGDSIVSMATGGGPLGDSKYPPSLFSGGASTPGGVLSPPTPGHRGTMYDNRGSMFTDNRTSMAFSTFGSGGGLVAYAYDPDEDDDSDDDEDDWLHDPEVAYPGSSPSKLKNKAAARKSIASSKANSDAPISGANGGVTPSASSNGGHSSTTTNSDLKAAKKTGVAVPTAGLRQPDPSKIPPNFHGMSTWSWRGIINIATLIGVITALLCLFAVYPIVRMGMDEGVASRITGNTRINATGQAVEDGFGGGDNGLGGADNADTTSTSTRARPTATELNPQGGTNDRRELPVARAEPLPGFPAPTWAPVGQLPILEEYELEERQGIVRMERICVPTNHGVEVEVGYTVGKEKGKAFWFNGEWRLHHQYRDDQLDRKSRPTMMLLGEKGPFTNTKDHHHQDVTVSLVVGLPLEKKHTRVRYVKFHVRPLSNSRVMGGGRLKYKYGSKAKLDMCELGETKRVDLELEMGDVVARIGRGEAWS